MRRPRPAPDDMAIFKRPPSAVVVAENAAAISRRDFFQSAPGCKESCMNRAAQNQRVCPHASITLANRQGAAENLLDPESFVERDG